MLRGIFYGWLVIHKWTATHKSNIKGRCAIVMGFTVGLILTYLEYNYLKGNMERCKIWSTGTVVSYDSCFFGIDICGIFND